MQNMFIFLEGKMRGNGSDLEGRPRRGVSSQRRDGGQDMEAQEGTGLRLTLQEAGTCHGAHSSPG